MTKLTSIQVIQGERDTEWLVQGYDRDGREYTHEVTFQSHARAERLASRVKAAGLEIDPDHWFMRVPYGCNAWIEDGCEYDLWMAERYYGLGEGTELAHVW